MAGSKGGQVAYVAVPAPSLRAEMWFDGPARQRRWTVLLRIVLAIPQYLVLFFVILAALIVVIIGWFAALVIGRLPGWVHQFVTGVVRWQTRVGAYGYLLTDQYPPFSFDDEEYPVRPILPPNGKLSRWSVLFRFILLIPAAFFSTVVSYGLVAPLLIVTWFIVLISGQMPTSLFWAYAALNRYLMRYQAFAFMLTSEYPWGMFGDPDPLDPYAYRPPTAPFAWPGDPPPPPPPAAPTSFQGAPDPTVGGAPASSDPSTVAEPSDTPASGAEASGEATASAPPPFAPAWATPPPQPPPPQWMSAPPPSAPPTPGWMAPPPAARAGTTDRSRMTLPPGARGWLVFAIIWGVILFGTNVTFNSIEATNNANKYSSDYNTVVSDFNNSKSAIDTAISQSRSCTTTACLRPSHLAAATSLQQFASDVRAMNLPSGAQQTAQSVESDATQLADAFTQLANSPNGQAYRSAVQSSGVNTLLQTLPNDTNSLLSQLNHYLECPPSATGFAICG